MLESRPVHVKTGSLSVRGNDFGNERGHRTGIGFFSETTSWLWLLLIIGLLLLYMGGRE